jgi:hypothetical protein
MRKQYWPAALCLGIMTFCGGYNLWAADAAQAQGSDLKAKMQAEGWKQIAEGVFERQRGGNKVEHLGYGREGLAWTIAELGRQLNVLHQEYQSYPSEDLAKVIDHLSIKVANAKRELRNMASTENKIAGASCNICYSATADAYPLSGSSQGVGAMADAKFNSDCGYSGDSYAYAYARATLNGTVTTHTQEDPHTGISVTSHASAIVNGSSNCSSNANSYAQSTALGISYSTSDSNIRCPAPTVTFTAAIGGPASVSGATCKTVTWTSTLTGGTSPFTYAWTVDGTSAGTGSSASRTFCADTIETATVSLTVRDSASHTATAGYSTYIDIESLGGGCNPTCQ